MFISGSDTNTLTVTMQWAMVELFLDPKKMQKVSTKLAANLGSKEFVKKTDLVQLPYLQAVSSERDTTIAPNDFANTPSSLPPTVTELTLLPSTVALFLMSHPLSPTSPLPPPHNAVPPMRSAGRAVPGASARRRARGGGGKAKSSLELGCWAGPPPTPPGPACNWARTRAAVRLGR
ncbi:hypothetical protein PR202_ga31548 [Eleusine coracana subsp. coracana]|uniref:Uncharacterized protein n=1 Tax=Eleusine coracana subsp. coracana TaxID=191504 RepID=A0AAV5DRQ3_ELECO|nr:hypothetical protein PR202_ga31548 [Eleusine coracana subsp. coracana]